MTDQLKGLVVTLEVDVREDCAKNIINAIKMIKGVASVDEVIANPDDHINRQRIKIELTRKLFTVLE